MRQSRGALTPHVSSPPPCQPRSDPTPLCLPQSLQNSSYNHFAAIYYLLLERLKEYRNAQPSVRPGPARQPRPRSSDLSGFEVRGGPPSKAPPRLPVLNRVPQVVDPCLDAG